MGNPLKTITYTYGDSSWGDLLTAYNGKAITYDGIGNPLTYNGWSFTWEHGRELVSMSKSGTTWTYTYDANGMRTSRSNGTTTYTYIYNGNQLVQMSDGSNILYFTYNANGHPMTVTLNGTLYYYITNLQGDVTAIWNPTNEFICDYIYDAWGKLQRTITYYDDPIIELNPLRYRGYVYDQETSLYYLQSRYYNPEWGRFLNADAFVSTGQGLTGNNMFVYCGNNPVCRKDDGGEWWHLVVGAIVGVVSQYVSDVVSSLASGESLAEALVPTSSAVDYLAAAASGALAASGVGTFGSAVANATIDGVAYVTNCRINGEEVNGTELLLTIATSAITSKKGVDGDNLRGVHKRSKQVLETAVSSKKIAMYTLKKKEVGKKVVKAIGESLLEGTAGGIFRGVRWN